MKVYTDLDAFVPPAGGTTLTIGNFDGVHRGHRALLATARQIAGSIRTPVVVMTFEPHPIAVLAPARAPARLVTVDEKLHLLEACGADDCLVLRSEPALLQQTAEEFVKRLADCCRPRALIEGSDFNFGRGRDGSIQTLRDFAERLGYRLHVVETTRCDELPGEPAVRSSAIRAALREGRVGVAAAMLGRVYRVTGTVGHGAGRGATLGFPTANLEGIPQLLPRHAVYAAIAQLPGGELRPAAVNVGPQPTFDEGTSRVEAHVLDWTASLVGQRMGLHFVAQLRGQQRFGGPEELIAQLHQDVAATRTHAAAYSPEHLATLPL